MLYGQRDVNVHGNLLVMLYDQLDINVHGHLVVMLYDHGRQCPWTSMSMDISL